MSRLDIKSARRLRKKGEGACVYAHNFLFSFYYLFIFPYRFQAPPIAAGTLLLGPLLPSRSPVPFVRLTSHARALPTFAARISNGVTRCVFDPTSPFIISRLAPCRFSFCTGLPVPVPWQEGIGVLR